MVVGCSAEPRRARADLSEEGDWSVVTQRAVGDRSVEFLYGVRVVTQYAALARSVEFLYGVRVVTQYVALARSVVTRVAVSAWSAARHVALD